MTTIDNGVDGADTGLLEGLRILFIVGPMVVGGAERQAMLLAQLLRDDYGASVEFWAINGGEGKLIERLDEKGLPWQIIPGPLVGVRGHWRFHARHLKRFFSLARALERARFDVIMPFMSLPSTIISIIWRMTSARACIWNQRSDGTDIPQLNIARTARWAALNATACVSNSAVGARYVHEKLGVDPRRLHVVKNGVRLNPPERSREQWRDELCVGDDCFVATMIANLHAPKDHPMLLRAWSIVQLALERRRQRSLLVLAGRPTETFDELTKLARMLRIDDSVRFLGAVRDVSGVLGASDLAVFSSRREGTPNGVLESMAAGLPVIATDLPGIREALGEGTASSIVPVGDAEAMAEAILANIDDPALRMRAGEQNRRRIVEEFSPDLMAGRFARIIVETLDSTNGRQA